MPGAARHLRPAKRPRRPRSFGGPVCRSRSSRRQILHKTDIGGVLLDVPAERERRPRAPTRRSPQPPSRRRREHRGRPGQPDAPWRHRTARRRRPRPAVGPDAGGGARRRCFVEVLRGFGARPAAGHAGAGRPPAGPAARPRGTRRRPRRRGRRPRRAGRRDRPHRRPRPGPRRRPGIAEVNPLLVDGAADRGTRRRRHLEGDTADEDRLHRPGRRAAPDRRVQPLARRRRRGHQRRRLRRAGRVRVHPGGARRPAHLDRRAGRRQALRRRPARPGEVRRGRPGQPRGEPARADPARRTSTSSPACSTGTASPRPPGRKPEHDEIAAEPQPGGAQALLDVAFRHRDRADRQRARHPAGRPGGPGQAGRASPLPRWSASPSTRGGRSTPGSTC